MLARIARRYPIIGGTAYAVYSLFDLKQRRDQYLKMQENAPHAATATVFMWPFELTIDGSQNGNIGHMAIQFGHHYVSLWPTCPQATYSTQYAVKLLTAEGYLSSMREDIRLEQRKPSTVLIVRGLNKEKMQSKLCEMQHAAKGDKLYFQVFYNYSFFNKSDIHAMNCTSAVNEILVAGGLPVARKHIMPWGSSPIAQYTFYRAIGVEEITAKKEKNAAISRALDLAKK